MITWTIDALEARLSDAEIAAREAAGPVVVRATWRVTAQDGRGSASVGGVQEFEYQPEADFTPFDELTEPQVLAWVHHAMGQQRMIYEDIARQRLAQQRAAPITLPLPWHVPPPAISGNGHDGLVG
jgi:hypothetical protein